MTAKPDWSHDQITLLRQLWVSGASLDAMCSQLGKSYGAITKKRVRLKLPKRPVGGSKPRSAHNKPRQASNWPPTAPYVRKAILHPQMKPVPIEATLNGKGCRFAINDFSPYLFCNNEGHPWCADHERVVHNS